MHALLNLIANFCPFDKTALRSLLPIVSRKFASQQCFQLSPFRAAFRRCRDHRSNDMKECLELGTRLNGFKAGYRNISAQSANE